MMLCYKSDKIMTLTKFEKEMIKTISKYTPISELGVLSVWYKCDKSYDKTIYCINKSQQLGIQPEDLCE
jgi:hypothetical protein